MGVASPSYQLHLSQDSAAKPTTNTWTVSSDRKLKKEIAPFGDGLNVVMRINPVKYKLNGKAGLPLDGEGIGVIAEDVQKLIPYTIRPFRAKMNPKDKKDKEVELLGFNSGPLTFVLINAVKEQQSLIEKQRFQIAELTARLEALEAARHGR